MPWKNETGLGAAPVFVTTGVRDGRGGENLPSSKPSYRRITTSAWLLPAGTEALGNLAEQVEIEDTQLLRRLIARRCTYGVDINPVAVDLARLSIWVHTFVPGLPLSLLDHNLVIGNSLVGIGRIVVEQDEFGNLGLDGACDGGEIA